MADPLSTDEGQEQTSAKENFVGRVVTSEVSSENYGMDDQYKNAGSSYYEHLYEIDVLDHDWGNIHEFSLEVNNNFQSKWMVVIGHLQSIHGNLEENQGIETLEDLEEFLEGKVYEFKEITWERDETFDYPGTDESINFGSAFSNSQNTPNPLIVPVREVTDEDEIQEAEVDDDTEIDEDISL